MFGQGGFILEINLPQLQALLREQGQIPEGGYIAGLQVEKDGESLAVKINGCGPGRLEGMPYERRGCDCPESAR